MASNKKKQDEKHLKNLREMVALPHNKQCFDCHQRGPTYINMTIGAYVCTACSGLLRGLNPPHRVKSISMASFTPDEMEFLKTHGNEYCRKVWLGLYDNRLGSQSESRDESKVKDFMSQKYERKRYYVAPTESMKEEARQMNESAIPKTPGTRPLKSLLGNGAPKLVVGTQQAKAPVHPRATISATPPPISSTHQSPGGLSVQSSRSAGSSAMGDLLGDIGSDPFSSSSTPSQTPAGGGFADFGNFGNTSSSQPAAFSQSTPLQPFGNTPQTSQPAFNGFPPAASSSQPAGQPAPAAPLGGDKYSNLSDLFSVASTAESTSSSANCNRKSYYIRYAVTAVKDGYCWKYQNWKYQMKGAANQCRKFRARLPALNTVAKTRVMQKFIRASRKAKVYPSGNKAGDEFWISPISNSHWKSTNAKVSYQSSNERASNGRGLKCVLFNYKTATWRYSDCSGRHPTICEEAHEYPDENPKVLTTPKPPNTSTTTKTPPTITTATPPQQQPQSPVMHANCNHKSNYISDAVTAVKDGYCWKYLNRKYQMKGAAEKCSGLHARLPALNTVAKTRVMQKFIRASRKAKVYPSGNMAGDEFWISPIDNSHWKSTNAKVSYQGSNERASNGRGMKCVLFNYKTATWRYSDCSGRHPTVCEEAHEYLHENPKGSTAPKPPNTSTTTKMPTRTKTATPPKQQPQSRVMHDVVSELLGYERTYNNSFNF